MARTAALTSSRAVASAAAVFQNLDPRRYEAVPILIEKDGRWSLPAVPPTRLSAADVLGLLDDYPTRSGYLITPVIAWAASAQRLAPNPDEVASVHQVTLAEIAAGDAFDFTSIPESDRRVVRFRYDGDYIHAPTAALIYQFREVLAGRATRVADLEQPVFAWK